MSAEHNKKKKSSKAIYEANCIKKHQQQLASAAMPIRQRKYYLNTK